MSDVSPEVVAVNSDATNTSVTVRQSRLGPNSLQEEKTTWVGGETRRGVPGTHTRTILGQLLQQPAPLLPEDVGPSETAVPANDTQVGDAPLHQVVSGFQAAFPGTEGFAPGAANNGPALKKK